MRGLLISLAVILAAPAATAQIVHPNQYATTEGIGANAFPFRYSQSAGHYQQAYDATQFGGPMTITEISFRYKADSVRVAATADFKLRLCYSANPWTSLSSTFSSNIGAGSKVVFDGVWSIPAFSGDPLSPNPFTERLTLTNPFPYDPAKGDLLMDVEMRQSAYPASAGAFAYSAPLVGITRVFANTGSPTSASGTFSSYALITEFTGPSDIVPFGTGCAGAGGIVPALSMTGSPQIGQQVNLALDQCLGGTISALMISLGQSSVPLGGGCTLLLAGTPFVVFIPLGGTGPGGGSYVLPAVIPLSTPPATIYLQAFVGDPASIIGMAVSNGLEVKIS